jgi:tRNA dimethylallyltransferase
VTKLLAILGPTAAGKTRMAVEVAEALDERGRAVEIVSCDSMAVYRGFDVVAAKPSADERSRVPHHLLDVVDVHEDFTVVEYRDLARAAIDDITRRGAVPALVGGSGLYFRGVVDDLEYAPTSADVRARLERQDPEDLLGRLRDEDPATAERLDPRNVRRVVRAVEVLELTGRRPSELREAWDRAGRRYSLTAVGLAWDRDELLARAEQRIRRQLELGFVEEVRAAGRMSRTAGQALGVKEALAYLEGKSSIEEATTEMVRATKGLIRRQISWFKADARVEWIDVSEAGWDDARTAIVERFVGALAGPAV